MIGYPAKTAQLTTEPTWQRPWWKRLVQSDQFWGWLFVAPTVLGLVIFSVGPIVAGFAISLTEWNIVGSPRWVGLANYRDLLFGNDAFFWTALRATVIYTVCVIPLQMTVSLLIAVGLNQGRRFQTLFRTLFFLPAICSIVALALVWRVLFDFRSGLLNWLLQRGGLHPEPWLLTPRNAMISVVLVSAWQGIGYPIVIWLAGLQSIPRDYTDAARVDGAGRATVFRTITLPLLTPTTFFILIISTINSFQVFEQTYVLTPNGGPHRAVYTLVYYIYDEAFRVFAMGRASAIGYILFMIILVLSLAQLRLQRRWVHYDL
jgi:multiple sugar transport system permease protein